MPAPAALAAAALPLPDTPPPLADTPWLLQTRQLVGARNGQRLWGPLDLGLAAGQALHVQGANGSGKTTLLRVLAGLRPPALGRVQTAPVVQAQGLWWLGHALPLADALDATRNLRQWLALAGAPAAAQDGVAPLLRALGVPAGRPLRGLSAGQRRKAGLAVLALAPRPLWLLDEPLDALDTEGADWLAALAAAHLARGGALVLTAHQALPAGFPAAQGLALGSAAAARLAAGPVPAGRPLAGSSAALQAAPLAGLSAAPHAAALAAPPARQGMAWT